MRSKRTSTQGSSPSTASPPAGISAAQSIANSVRKLKDFDASLAMGGDGPPDSVVRSYISTQIATVNYAIRRPGFPTGRLSVVIGSEGASKSTITDHLLSETQKLGGIGILVDAEGARDQVRMQTMGINTDELIIIKGNVLEPAFRAIEKLVLQVKKDFPDTVVCIVVDSLAGMVAQGAMDKEIGDASVALISRQMSTAILPRLVPLLGGTQIALVIVNQLRMHIQPFTGMHRAQERRKVMGDKAMVAEGPLVYWASLVLHVATTGLVGEKEDPTGIQVRAIVRKDRVGPGEGHTAEYEVDYLTGANKVKAVFDLLVSLGDITLNGGWYKLAGVEDAQNFRAADFPAILEANPWLQDIADEAPLLWSAGATVVLES